MSVTTRPARAHRGERLDPAPPARPAAPVADRSGRRGVRPDIEGLRTLAVLAIDLNHWLCPPGAACPAVRDGGVMYRDDSHVTDTAMTLLGPNVDRLLAAGQIVPSTDHRSTS